MPRTLRSPLASLGSVATLALLLSACSDPVAPGAGAGPVPSPNFDLAAAATIPLASGTATVYVCPEADAFSTSTANCEPAFNVARNVRWNQIAGTSWISNNPDGNQSYSEPAQYYWYKVLFELPSGFTGASLDFDVFADNAATLYLNSTTSFAGHANQSDWYPNYGCNYLVPSAVCGPENDGNDYTTLANPNFVGPTSFATAAGFVAGTNVLTIRALNAIYLQSCVGAGADPTTCESATGLNFTATVAYVPPVCDFMTFGRLVTEHDGEKVVISGNAGGNKPHGGILGEMNIEIGGTTYHVADIDTYGPIASGVLAGYENARIFTGIAKNGSAVEVRMWDGGEPGKGTDRVYVKIAGGPTVGEQLLDQGNLQYHPTCRGPN